MENYHIRKKGSVGDIYPLPICSARKLWALKVLPGPFAGSEERFRAFMDAINGQASQGQRALIIYTTTWGVFIRLLGSHAQIFLGDFCTTELLHHDIKLISSYKCMYTHAAAITHRIHVCYIS